MRLQTAPALSLFLTCASSFIVVNYLCLRKIFKARRSDAKCERAERDREWESTHYRWSCRWKQKAVQVIIHNAAALKCKGEYATIPIAICPAYSGPIQWGRMTRSLPAWQVCINHLQDEKKREKEKGENLTIIPKQLIPGFVCRFDLQQQQQHAG